MPFLKTVVDPLIRFGLSFFFVFNVVQNTIRIVRYLQQYEVSDILYVADIAVSISGVVFTLTMASVLLLQRPAKDAAVGILPRVVALGGTLSSMTISSSPYIQLSLWGSWLSVGLILGGYAVAGVSLWYLGRSFSIIAEARAPVIDGPYRLVRHPLYLAEMVAMAGFAIQYMSLMTFGIVILNIGLQLKRMDYEEAVLTRYFSDYATYAKRTFRLVPFLY